MADTTTNRREQGNARRRLNRHKALEEGRVAERRHRVAQLYLQGKPQHVIAKEVNIGAQTVMHDLKAMREMWRLSAEADFSEKKAQELAKIDRLEQAAWEAWEKSKEDGELIRTTEKLVRPAEPKVSNPKGGRPRKESYATQQGKMKLIQTTREHMRKGQDGDPRFLEQVGRCIELRLRVMGLLKAGSKGGQGGTVILNWGDMIMQPTRQQEGGVLPNTSQGHETSETPLRSNEVLQNKVIPPHDPIEERINRAQSGREGGRPLGLPAPKGDE